MKNSRSFFFIINPISGNGKGKKVAEMIEKNWPNKNINYEIHFTTAAGDAIRLAEEGIKSDKEIIVAVGGDGTVNEISGSLFQSNKTLGIIPIGSGNGLARELNIPLVIKAALSNLLNAPIYKMDIGFADNKVFNCTSGIGFDAHMGNIFKTSQTRGIVGYIQLFFKEFFNYHPSEYKVTIDGITKNHNAFFITIGNCRQWGNSFYISPKSKNDDGKLEVCIIKDFPKLIFPVLAYRLLNFNIDKSRYYEYLQGESIKIESEKPITFHTDGEPYETSNQVEFSVKKGALCIISNKS